VDVQDGNGHGTHCAGIACGASDPATGPRYGVAGGADLYVGRVLDDMAHGSDRGFLAALEWAVGQGCRIVSASLGQRVAPGTPYSRVIEQAARRALRAGTLVLGSAGNDSDRPTTVEPVSHPANCPSILAVAAVGSDMAIGAFSNGTAGAADGRVDLAGPGIDVYSSYPMPFRYRRLNGTSMATPYAAGVAALLLQRDPGLSGLELRDALLEHTQPLELPSDEAGRGLVVAPEG
jgi:subtilisin family serine protease